jgi:hypothetical protein
MIFFGYDLQFMYFTLYCKFFINNFLKECKNMFRFKVLISILFLLYSLGVVKAEGIKGLYLGAGVGLEGWAKGSEIKDNGDVSNDSIRDDYSHYPSIDEARIPFSVMIGYDVLSFMSVEFDYTYGMKNSYEDEQSDGDVRKFEDSYNQFHLSAVFKKTFEEKYTPFAAIGLGYLGMKSMYESTSTMYDGISTTATKDEYSYSGFSLKFAFGYEQNLNSHNIIGVRYDINYAPSLNTTYDTSFTDVDGSVETESFKENGIFKSMISYVSVYYKYKF